MASQRTAVVVASSQPKNASLIITALSAAGAAVVGLPMTRRAGFPAVEAGALRERLRATSTERVVIDACGARSLRAVTKAAAAEGFTVGQIHVTRLDHPSPPPVRSKGYPFVEVLDEDVRADWPGQVARMSAQLGLDPDVFSGHSGGSGSPGHVQESTHLGPVADALVERLRRNQRPRGLSSDYDLLRDNFDVLHFLLQNPGLRDARRVDPVAYYLARGAEATTSPDINFSPRAYLERRPQRATDAPESPYLEWLRTGRERGHIADPAPGVELVAELCGRTDESVVQSVASIRTDLQRRLRTGELGRSFAAAAEVEPLIGKAWPCLANPVIHPFKSAEVLRTARAIQVAQTELGQRRARVVIVAYRPRWGSGKRAEGNIAHALAKVIPADDIVVVYTDASGSTPAGRFPVGVREVDLAAAVRAAGGSRRDAEHVLVHLLESLCPETVVNVNSQLLYDCLPTHEANLAGSTRLFHVMFCNDQDALGHWGGHPSFHFHRHIDSAAGVITDSEYLRDWFERNYLLGQGHRERLHVFGAPVDDEVTLVDPPAALGDRRPQVFWAGRMARQKRPDLVAEIARLMPDVDFRLWYGEGDVVETPFPANVSLEGAYDAFGSLPLGEADAWLYTSAWDGVPSQLLEVGMTGIPLVATLVGGTGEILDPDHSWQVTDIDDPKAYARALEDVLADPEVSRARARPLRALLLERRAAEPYAQLVADVLLGSNE